MRIGFLDENMLVFSHYLNNVSYNIRVINNFNFMRRRTNAAIQNILKLVLIVLKILTPTI